MNTNINRFTKLVFGCLVFLASSCVDVFEPEVLNAPESYLVVDGFINSNGVTTIKLTRTLNLKDASPPPAESQANVLIEEEGGAFYTLFESTPGTYTSDFLYLNANKKYRLHFFTSSGKEYASDYVAIKNTPAIDAITWKAGNDFQIYVNTHDATNQTLYYRWEYEDTWEFTSAFSTNLEYVNNQVQARFENIYRCWSSQKSSAIKINSTARLSQDVVSDYPLTSLPVNSFKLRYKYSILVKQYALTQEEYVYFETLRKNTENIGTLFDPLPTQLTGNIHAVNNPAEPVIGFVGACSVTEKRIFISQEELPEGWWQFSSGYESCLPPDTVELEDVDFIFSGGINLPVTEVYPPMGMPVLLGYTYSNIDCVDCRQRGTNVKPDFWE